MVSKILVLDDDLIRHEMFDEKFAREYPGASVEHAYTVKDCIAALSSGVKYDLVQLDHDLNDFGAYPESAPVEGVLYQVPVGQKEYTGADVAAWMAGAECLTGDGRPDMIIIHSWNYYGAQRMSQILSDAGFTVFQKMFTR